MDWINCNTCCRQPGDEQGRVFALSSCGHIFCDICLKGGEGAESKCLFCSTQCQLIQLSSKLKKYGEMERKYTAIKTKYQELENENQQLRQMLAAAKTAPGAGCQTIAPHNAFMSAGTAGSPRLPLAMMPPNTRWAVRSHSASPGQLPQQDCHKMQMMPAQPGPAMRFSSQPLPRHLPVTSSSFPPNYVLSAGEAQHRLMPQHGQPTLQSNNIQRSPNYLAQMQRMSPVQNISPGRMTLVKTGQGNITRPNNSPVDGVHHAVAGMKSPYSNWRLSPRTPCTHLEQLSLSEQQKTHLGAVFTPRTVRSMLVSPNDAFRSNF